MFNVDDLIMLMTTRYLSRKSFSGFNLHKNPPVSKIAGIYLPPELIRNNDILEISQDIDNEFRDAVNEFVKVLNESFSPNDLTNFYNNIASLKISFRSFFRLVYYDLIMKSKISASYLALDNKILIGDNNFLDTIYHELFHMASAVIKGDIVFSGFKQANTNYKNVSVFGYGLNEGYTQLLSERYFKLNDDVINPYYYEVHLAYHLEQIVGKDKMESLYLNANLLGLIMELEKYAKEDNILKFLSYFDYILTNSHRENTSIQKLHEALVYVNKFLVYTYASKLKKDYENELLSKEEVSNLLYDYFSSLGYTVILKNDEEYRYFDDDIDSFIEELLEEIIGIDEENIIVKI